MLFKFTHNKIKNDSTEFGVIDMSCQQIQHQLQEKQSVAIDICSAVKRKLRGNS
jgi:hypothetical protein